MKDNDLFEKIENSDYEIKERKERAKAKIFSELGIETKQAKPKKFSRRNILVIASSCLAVLIIIPIIAIVLSHPKIEQPTNRFCSQEDYNLVESTKTLKEFAVENEDLLYFDWETENSFVYNDKLDNNTILGINTSMINPETGMEIDVVVVFKNIQLGQIETQKKNLNDSMAINSIEIKYNFYLQKTIFSFEYNGYTYYIEIDEDINTDGIIEIVNELFSSETK